MHKDANSQIDHEEQDQEQVLIRDLKRLGPDSIEVADDMARLAQLNLHHGKLMVAEHLYKRSLDIRIRLLGPAHPDIAQSTRGLAAVYDVERKAMASAAKSA